MRILAYNPSHDGATVLLEDGALGFSVESEKDSGVRYSSLSLPAFVRSLQLSAHPDAVALSGFFDFEAGYFDEGPGGKSDGEMLLFGRQVRRFSSSHIRSHVMCSYGLSPFPQGQPCYALIWDGAVGALYHVDESVAIRKESDVLSAPGNKYALLYALADPTLSPTQPHWLKNELAGKVMALAAYGRRGNPTPAQTAVIEAILSLPGEPESFGITPHKASFTTSPFCDIGVESQEFKDLAFQFSNALFDRFLGYAQEHLTPGLPLLIGGGCGLNCDWNTQWKQCGLFSDVFVPPCTNDSGVALGCAIDALHHYTGKAKIEWSVYAGDSFIEDADTPPDFRCVPLDLSDVCRRLLEGQVIAWVQGRYEIGPRALGNRSLLAAPFSAASRDRLNSIKQREAFRPIAPICLEEDFGRHFDHHGASPHMLYFQRVKSPELMAVTHVDGSARAQSVNDAENPAMCALLRRFRELCGVAVLCNTSLNSKGHGFVNRLSHLFVLVRQRGIDAMVVGNRFWTRRSYE